MIIIDLINNLALLAALSVISGFVGDRLKNKYAGLIFQGILFGSIAVIGMLRPLNMGPGLIFDGRSVMISLCGLFFGPISAMIACVMTVSLRVYQGGIGAVAGVSVIISSTVLGVLFYYSFKKRNKEITAWNFFGFGIIVHIAMILLMFTLPLNIAADVIRKISLPVITVYPLATVLIGKVISDNISRSRFFEALKNSENKLRESEERIRSINNNMTSGMIYQIIIAKDGSRKFTYLSDSVKIFYGITPEEGMNNADLIYNKVHEDDITRFAEEESLAIKTLTIFKTDLRVRTSSAGIHWVSLVSVPKLLNDGSICFDGIEFDITGLKEADAEIKTKNEELTAAMEEMEATNEELITTSEELLATLDGRMLAENKIKNLLAEKELLLQEVHHRIKNNMNTIKGLLTLQLSAERDTSVIESLRDAETRVQSMIMLYDRLYCTENYRELSIKDYLQSLADDVVGSFPNSDIVKIKTNIDDFILNVNKLSPVGIIVNELLTNMMKYAFAGKDDGELNISASIKDNRASIVIGDNGVGIPESIIFQRSTGFGLDLVNMLTEQIGGTIKIERSEGTKFILEFEV